MSHFTGLDTSASNFLLKIQPPVDGIRPCVQGNTSFMVKELGSSENKMLILFFSLILSSLSLNNLYLLSTCNFLPYAL